MIPYNSKFQIIFCVPFSRTGSGLCIFNLAKFLSLALFLVDHHSHPVMPRLVLVLWLLEAFAYYVINRFISFPT